MNLLAIEIGSGKKPKPGFIHVDIAKLPGVNVVSTAWSLPFATGSVGQIYSRHCLEHLTLDQFKIALKEFRRVLAPEGKMELILPDIAYHFKQYFMKGKSPLPGNDVTNRHHALVSIFGWQRSPYDFHKWGYDEEYLQELITEAGFKNFTRLSDKAWNLRVEFVNPEVLIADISGKLELPIGLNKRNNLSESNSRTGYFISKRVKNIRLEIDDKENVNNEALCQNKQIQTIRKALVIGGYGSGNLGDFSQLSGTLENLSEMLPDTEVTVTSKNVERTKQYLAGHSYNLRIQVEKNFHLVLHQEKNNTGNRNWYKKRIEALENKAKLFLNNDLSSNDEDFHVFVRINQYDILYFSGSGTLNHTSATWGSTYNNLIAMLLFQLLKKKVIVSAQGVGPISDELDKEFIARTLNYADAVTVRDRESLELCHELGASGVELGVDDAYFIEADNNVDQILRKAGINPERNIAGINLSFYKYDHQLKQLLLNVANFFISQGIQVLVLVTEPHRDMDAAYDLAKGNPAIKVIERNDMNGNQIKGLISRLCFGIGTRNHFIVWSLANAVPCVGLGVDAMQEHKLKGLSRDLPLGVATVDDPQAVLDRVRNVFENSVEIHNQLVIKNRDLLERKGLALRRFLSNCKPAHPGLIEVKGISNEKSNSNCDNIFDVIKDRRSIRSFNRNHQIAEDDLNDLVTAGIWAPSGSNTQSQRFLILTKISDIDWLYSFRKGGGSLKTAAAVILVFSDKSVCHYNSDNTVESWEKGEKQAYTITKNVIKPTAYKRNHPVWNQMRWQDCAASIQNILLLATAKGIGSCWVSSYPNMGYSRLTDFKSWDVLYRKFNIAKTWEIMGMVALGYTDKTYNDNFEDEALNVNSHGIGKNLIIRKSVEECAIFN